MKHPVLTEFHKDWFRRLKVDGEGAFADKGWGSYKPALGK
jgi:hypothetical protein